MVRIWSAGALFCGALLLAATLAHSAEHYRRAAAKAALAGSIFSSPDALRPINAALRESEQHLLDAAGLPHRPWYRHMIYAPGLYTGYGVKTLPGVRESIEQKDWKLADEQTVRVGKVLENAGEAITGAASELSRSTAR